MTSSSELQSDFSEALDALRLGNPKKAELICCKYLDVNPENADYRRLLGRALMTQNRPAEAEKHLRLAINIAPGIPALHEDLGSSLAMQKKFEDAIPYFEQSIELDPQPSLIYKKLAQALAAAKRSEEADRAFEIYFEKAPDIGDVVIGAEHLRAGREEEAIEAFEKTLRKSPDNVNALRYLANIYIIQNKNLLDAEALLRRATDIAPDFMKARLELGELLLARHDFIKAIDCYKEATVIDGRILEAWRGLGNAYSMAGYPEKGRAAFEHALNLNPMAPAIQMGYGHILKTLGEQAKAVEAYREAIKLKPDAGEAYWSMANLKTFKFDEVEVEAMETQLLSDNLGDVSKTHFCFSLGKAFEDKTDYDKAWEYYHTGNQINRMLVSHDPVSQKIHVGRVIKVYDKEFLEANAGHGCNSPAPIFIVGLPRSGSTLIEQILASHSKVEGTGELPDLGGIAVLVGKYRVDGVDYPEAAKKLSNRDWQAFGEEYIDKTSRHRVTSQPYFTDKMPNNFIHIGFLQLILPDAKIINARRHPLDSCLGAYKQLFGSGQEFTYDIFDLTEYYKQYDKVMKHWHRVLPGKVLDVHYEETVTDLEWQVRRILDHCGLPFEEQCLRFYETKRAVKTASSEQVRQPIYQGALGKWRRYDKHLTYWKKELGYIVDELPQRVKKEALHLNM